MASEVDNLGWCLEIGRECEGAIVVFALAEVGIVEALRLPGSNQKTTPGFLLFRPSGKLTNLCGKYASHFFSP